MTRLIAILADLALHALAHYAAAATAEPEWTPEALDRLLEAVRQVQDDEDFALWSEELSA